MHLFHCAKLFGKETESLLLIYFVRFLFWAVMEMKIIKNLEFRIIIFLFYSDFSVIDRHLWAAIKI